MGWLYDPNQIILMLCIEQYTIIICIDVFYTSVEFYLSGEVFYEPVETVAK